MSKILDLHYNSIPNYERHKATLKELFLKYGNIPVDQFSQLDENGQDQMDLFFSAILRTLSFLHKNYGRVDLSNVSIPDKETLPFLEDHELSVSSLYMARILKNIYNVGFSTKNDSLGVCKLYYGPRLSIKRIEAMVPRFKAALIRTNERILITDERNRQQVILNERFYNEVVGMKEYGFLITQHLLANSNIMDSFCAGNEEWKDMLFKSILASKYSKEQLKDPEFMGKFIVAIESVRGLIQYAKPILDEKFKDLPRILAEKVMVHELLHSASYVNEESFDADNRMKVLKYAKVNDAICAMLRPLFNVLYTRNFFYETATEKLATDIMNSGLFVRDLEKHNGFLYLLKKQTNSAYATNDCNIRLFEILAARKPTGDINTHYLTNHNEEEFYSQFTNLYANEPNKDGKLSPKEIIISRFNSVHRKTTDGHKLSTSGSKSKQAKGQQMAFEAIKETEGLQADIVSEYYQTVFSEFSLRCKASGYKGITSEELLLIRQDISAMGELLQLSYNMDARTPTTLTVRDTILGRGSTFRDMTADLPVSQLSVLIKAGALAETENLTEYISLRQSFEKVENRLLRENREEFKDVVPSNELDRTNLFFNLMEEYNA